ncbi:hypothetical protein BJX99DRAFT_254153 [Aspergillus californicus]
MSYIAGGGAYNWPNWPCTHHLPPRRVSACGSGALPVPLHTILLTDPEAKNCREKATAILVRESTISADDISQAKNLKAIGKQGVGIEIINQEACAKRNNWILNTPGANAQSVAELVLSLTMAVARQLRPIAVRQAAGEEVRKKYCSAITLQGKTIGIVGMGNIGFAVGRIFRGVLNSPIYAYDPLAVKDAWSDLERTRVDNFEDMLPYADFQMMKNAILINAARGGIVNEDDLIQVLNNGTLYVAGLDCHEEPPTLQRYQRLWDTGRAISTPHIG